MQPIEEPKSRSQREQALVRDRNQQRWGKCVKRWQLRGLRSKGLRGSRPGAWTLPGGVTNPWPAPFSASAVGTAFGMGTRTIQERVLEAAAC